MAAKQLLRREVGIALKQLTRAEIEYQSKGITNALLPLLSACGRVACYVSMDDSEVDTQYLLEHLFDAGKAVYLPRCTSTRETGHVVLRGESQHHPHLTFHKMESWQQVQSLTPKGKYQLREPPREHPDPLPAKLDVMLVPGVAFSLESGARLGHGGGYYDDFFKRYKLQHNGAKPLLIGLALKQQLVEAIPMDDHDQRMDCIVEGSGAVHWTVRSE